jgi:hypothetical protein
VLEFLRAGYPTAKDLPQPTHCNQNFLLSVSITTMLVVFHRFAREVQLYSISACLNASRHESYRTLLSLISQGSTMFIYLSLYRINIALRCALSSDCAVIDPVCAIYAPFMSHLFAIYAHITTVYAHRHRVFVYAPPSVYDRIKSWPSMRFMPLILGICAYCAYCAPYAHSHICARHSPKYL